MFANIIIYALFFASVCALEKTLSLEQYKYFGELVNSKILTCNHSRQLNLDVSDTKIHFYDYSENFHKYYPIKDAAKGILNYEKLDKRKKYIMFVGGFKSHIEHSVERQMREAYKTYPDSYLIMPDHSTYTNNKDKREIKNYKRSVSHVHYIGKALGQMLAVLKLGGISPKNIHCVGHSLGGQILGHVGSVFFNVTGEKISRITALDPAGPGFANSAVENQVRSGVAEYVEVYHCNAGALGSSRVLGDVDFFMNNNGETNPYCRVTIVPDLIMSSKIASCNHRICIDVWTASVKHPNLFLAYNCDSYQNFKEGKCAHSSKTIAGSSNPCAATGKYYFSTENIIDLKSLV